MIPSMQHRRQYFSKSSSSPPLLQRESLLGLFSMDNKRKSSSPSPPSRSRFFLPLVHDYSYLHNQSRVQVQKAGSTQASHRQRARRRVSGFHLQLLQGIFQCPFPLVK